ncbi:MAG: quinone-dependent dihydroorotate dehydrogenase [Propionibacteriaceae bacterium]|jgi:dihydroorotate dehydrogenase|nr:quinone-dependent dihydroorotate dehydrogenase [Propionibacteriaceae bacterium]
MSLRTEFVAGGYTQVLRPLLFRTDPEIIHERMIRLLSSVGSNAVVRTLLRGLTGEKGRPTTVAGVDFPTRVGLAAGLDKDGLASRAWHGLGFGFAELGTVTAFAQPGNEKPRLFRAVSSAGLVNRMGFNNAGAAELARTLAGAGIYRGNRAAGIPVGISIGKSKIVGLDGAVEDYLTSLTLLAEHADYFAVNVSSPNTPQLRLLQDGGALVGLLRALTGRAAQLAQGQDSPPVPIFVKVAPDLSWGQLDEVINNCEDCGAAGIIATNTTLRRDQLAAADLGLAEQEGGLSGRPLTERALAVVSYIAERSELPVIGSGGIMTEADAKAMFDAGAALIQLYTGFIYQGPALAMRINAEDRRRA